MTKPIKKINISLSEQEIEDIVSSFAYLLQTENNGLQLRNKFKTDVKRLENRFWEFLKKDF